MLLLVLSWSGVVPLLRARISAHVPTTPCASLSSCDGNHDQPALLRNTKRWGCISGCGACCYLKPNERDGLDEWLTSDELQQYEDMVGNDG